MKIAKKNLASRIVVSGDKVEFYDYEKPMFVDYEHRPGKHEKTEDKDKRNDNLFRCRRAVRRIVWCNIGTYSKFLTLTYSDTMLDVKVFKRHFQTFLQAMKRKGYDLRYLYVLERQKKRGKKEGNAGTIHAHIIIFNDEFIPIETIQRCWKHGTFDLHLIDGLRDENKERVRDVGAYVCKYITKESLLEFGTRCYNCSVGLKRPEEYSFYAYGEVDDRGVPNYVEENRDTFELIKSCCDIEYEKTSYLFYTLSDGSNYTNRFQHMQGTKKINLEILSSSEVYEVVD